jgi:transcription antitermination factor NusG
LFPGYVFARFEIETQYRAVIHARGVRKVVSFGENPAIVDDAMIDSIKKRLSEGCLVLPCSEFRSGQVVRIHEGPLRGLEGVFQKQISGSQRAILLLRALSYQAKVVVHLGDIVNL